MKNTALIILITLLCLVFRDAEACDVMRPCYSSGRLLYEAQQAVTPSRHTHRVMPHRAGVNFGVVRSASGVTARVAARAAPSFQCLVDHLERQGYPVRFMGGYRRYGSVRGSLHPSGLALDINQYARNRTKPRMPTNEIALANACHLVSGAQWGWADSGHFQLGGWAGRGRHYATHRRHRRKHYASAP